MIKINLAIRATDDPNKVKEMLEFLRNEGLLTEEGEEPTAPRAPRPNVSRTVLDKYGPNETEWRGLNPNTRAPTYKAKMQSLFPSKEDMFAAALNGTLTQAAIAASNREEPSTMECVASGAVFTGRFEMPVPNEEDFND